MAESSEPEVLWQPSERAIEEAQVTQFARQVIRKRKLDVNTYPETLQAMAAAGGTGDYFAANSPDELSQALDAIAAEVGLPSCSFRLDSTPEDSSAIAVSQDGVPVSQDPSHMNGWDYGSVLP